jgi:predicted nucleic acid-binding protein
MDDMIGHNNPELYRPQAELDVKDQHIVALSMKNGFLIGRNSVLENTNARLQQQCDKQERQIKDGTDENKRQREALEETRDRMWTAEREVDRLKQYEKYAPKAKAKK